MPSLAALIITAPRVVRSGPVLPVCPPWWLRRWRLLVAVREGPAVRRDGVLDRRRAPRTWLIELDRRRVLQQRRRDLPQPVDLIGPGEQRLVAEHRLQDQSLVPLEAMHLVERVLVAEGHLDLAQLHRRPRLLGQEPNGDPAGIVEVDDDLVAALARWQMRDVREHPQRRLFEPQRDGLPALRHRFA